MYQQFSLLFVVSYIDPNAGGWLFQLLFPVFVAVGGAWMVFRQRFKAVVSKILKRKPRDRSPPK
jgi:hypothetical protein